MPKEFDSYVGHRVPGAVVWPLPDYSNSLTLLKYHYQKPSEANKS